jgi:hypothetical protein
MTCDSNFKNVGGEVCLSEYANPYVSSIVGFFLSIDKSMTWGYNFRDYGAADRNRITAEEIFVST